MFNGKTKDLFIINEANNPYTDHIVYPFAFEEVLGKYSGEQQVAIVHIWRHHKAFVMGPRDGRLPHVKQAAKWLKNQGFDVMVRNSGGAAVPLNKGVVNISIILPMTSSLYNIDEDFNMMFQLIKKTLKENNFKIEKGEVRGAYCPGAYDLSIEGKKFCGIAQRRQLKAFNVQAFLNIESSGENRANLVKRFYEIAAGQTLNNKVPVIIPEKMTSIQEISQQWNVSRFLKTLDRHLIHMGGKRTNIDGLGLTHKKEIDRISKELLMISNKRLF